MQAAYFEGHHKAIDRGWQSVAQAVTDSGVDQGQAQNPSGGAQTTGQGEDVTADDSTSQQGKET
ncbi:hypothetical protein MLC59_04400 [Marinobacter bryozoorum]|uniref:hypothetical protein n=1 Tax=Marinobacter bryozoorum TaxID=256324 RepID=UPI00200629CA|nr:hypothetical protein [Marinobacter bryozoorum]MCK7543402.1 hypothetical protein [Marinobacter bryozoorum]